MSDLPTADPTAPFADHDPSLPTDYIRDLVDRSDRDDSLAEVADSFRRDAWLTDPETDPSDALPRLDCVADVDPSGGREHNVHVRLTQSATPADMEFGPWLDWFVRFRRTVQDLGWRITNKRLVDEQLVVTLAPDE